MKSEKTCELLFPTGQQEGTRSVVSRWLKRVGDRVSIHEPILEISTDKVTMEVAAPESGVLKEILKREDEETGPGDVLGVISLEDAGDAVTPGPLSQSGLSGSTVSAGSDAAENQRLSPAVRKMLSDCNLSPDQIKGSGRDGRITYEDVRAYLVSRESSGAVSSDADPSTSDVPANSSRFVPHTAMRKAIAKHMVESMLETAPHVTSVFDSNLEAIVAHREREKKNFEKRGVKLTFTSYFIQAAAKALMAVPVVNSRYHPDKLEIFNDCHIGVATALGPDGLIVPVVRDAAKLDLFQIATVLQDLTDRARNNKLNLSDLQGGTFTITNHGISGSLIATPIISQPQSAILGIGKIERRPVVVTRDGRETIEPQSRAYVTLTIDHRALDGFATNLFLTEFVGELESYS